MLQGTGSNVGKSVLVAGLCRAYARRGLSVRPFKPHCSTCSAAVTAEGGEIGRAQALQARAAGIAPSVHMNPVLLKPETETGAQVVLQGRRIGAARAGDYARMKPDLMAGVMESYRRIGAGADLVLVEGAGSPAEVNLRAGDIANMGFAAAAAVPVVLAADIDRGGVIAQVVGTHAVVAPGDAALIKGFLINKFRGDVRLAAPPRLPAEDAADIRPDRAGGAVKIVCLQLSRIANFDDLDPLKIEPGVTVAMVRAGEPVPGDADLVIVPGSKSTRGDLDYLRAQGWDVDLAAHRRRGGRILGICGGYQMLGRTIADPAGIEGAPGVSDGLGFLDVETVMSPEKRLTRVTGEHLASGAPVEGYEIHIGRTEGPDRARPMFRIGRAEEGAQSPDGRVGGAYLHGLFAGDEFRRAFLAALGAPAGTLSYDAEVEATLDRLAAHLEAHLDLDRMLGIARAGA